eukprot:m.229588 g.229588  ORF g.229588 m.229588 type:complete len:348 (-) comp11925_c0_seq1:174-1217(-)
MASARPLDHNGDRASASTGAGDSDSEPEDPDDIIGESGVKRSAVRGLLLEGVGALMQEHEKTPEGAEDALMVLVQLSVMDELPDALMEEDALALLQGAAVHTCDPRMQELCFTILANMALCPAPQQRMRDDSHLRTIVAATLLSSADAPGLTQVLRLALTIGLTSDGSVWVADLLHEHAELPETVCTLALNTLNDDLLLAALQAIDMFLACPTCAPLLSAAAPLPTAIAALVFELLSDLNTRTHSIPLDELAPPADRPSATPSDSPPASAPLIPRIVSVLSQEPRLAVLTTCLDAAIRASHTFPPVGAALRHHPELVHVAADLLPGLMAIEDVATQARELALLLADE